MRIIYRITVFAPGQRASNIDIQKKRGSSLLMSFPCFEALACLSSKNDNAKPTQI